MRKGLSVVGQVIYVVVMLATGIIDLVIQINLIVSGNLGGAFLYFILGWPITLTIGHWLGMLLAMPFALAGGLGSDD